MSKIAFIMLTFQHFDINFFGSAVLVYTMFVWDHFKAGLLLKNCLKDGLSTINDDQIMNIKIHMSATKHAYLTNLLSLCY